MSKAHIPPAVAIIGHTTLFLGKKNWINKGTDKQCVADSFIHNLELVINDVYTEFQNPRSSSS